MRISPIAACLLMITAALSMGANAEDGSTKYGFNPGGINIVDPLTGGSLAGAGQAQCQDLDPDLPLYCANDGVGGVRFDISHLREQKFGQRKWSVLQGTLTATVMSCSPCGTTIVAIGTDRDDDGVAGNVDDADNDTPGNTHGSDPDFDDQFAMGTLGPNQVPGDTITIPFCFAHDTPTAGHDWDELIVSLFTDSDSLSAGTVELTLSDLQKVGDYGVHCKQFYRANTVGWNQCNDGLDNDLDGGIDWGGDFSCQTPEDDDESAPIAQCQDGIDNDGDGFADWPLDPDCSSPQDNNEQYQPPMAH